MTAFSEFMTVIIWPLVIVALVHLFKNDLKGFVSRVFRVKFPGVEIEAEKIKEIQQQVSIMIPTLEVDFSKEEQLNIIKNLQFERMYNVLLPTQLEFLSTLGAHRISHAFYKDLFESYQDDNQPVFDTWTSDDFLYFLVKNDLIDVDDETLSLSHLGEEFIEYLRIRNYPLEKWI